MKTGAKKIIRELLERLNAAETELAKLSNDAAQDFRSENRPVIKSAYAYVDRKPAKRMVAKAAKSQIVSVTARTVTVHKSAKPGETVAFTGADGFTAFEATLIGQRLRIYSPGEKFAVIPEDRYCVELMPYVDDAGFSLGAAKVNPLPGALIRSRKPRRKAGK